MLNDFKKQGLRRIAILAVVIAFLFSLDAFRVFYISTVKGDEYSAKAESQQLSSLSVIFSMALMFFEYVSLYGSLQS